ncbi:SCO3242 family prenyltransferase [Streptomyces pratensis]|uniref:SCO3242 family prenyltransferase n=1 Tax=Streptomyces pratensis TaxID=1169025 RepID=UPI0030166FED
MKRWLPAAAAALRATAPAGRRYATGRGGKSAAARGGLPGAGGTAAAPGRRPTPPASRSGEGEADAPAREAARRGAGPVRLRAWAELLRVSALFSVPGDALAGAAAVGRRPGRGTALAVGASLCLYEAGMALNDWADREEDAVDRPHRPIPSGRVSPAAALTAAGVLTGAGLALAARAGRPSLTVATGLAATVWAYDLRLKHTKAGPAAMAAARSLDLLLGATAAVAAPGAGELAPARRDNVAGSGHGAGASARTRLPSRPPSRPGAAPRTGMRADARAALQPGTRTAARPGAGSGPRARSLSARTAAVAPALPAALVLGAHTYGVTAVSRHEAHGGSTGTPLAVLTTTVALAAAVLAPFRKRALGRYGPAAAPGGVGTTGAGARPLVVARPARGGAGRPGAAGTRGPGAGGARPSAPRPEAARAARPGRPDARHPTRPFAPAFAVPERAAGPASLLAVAFTGAYLRTAGPPLLHAALNPSPPLTQRAVGGGIRAMIPLQAALAARAGAPVTALAVMALAPLARTLARKVSPT